MDVDQVGIPHHVAMSLTVPERVTNDNIESLTRRIVNGPAHIYGAENVITSNGITINLENCENREKIRLQYGWVVERFLADNDVVIFNRQPSLHKVGMMGHRVKLMSGNTFRLNLCCANPYNAGAAPTLSPPVPSRPPPDLEFARAALLTRVRALPVPRRAQISTETR